MNCPESSSPKLARLANLGEELLSRWIATIVARCMELIIKRCSAFGRVAFVEVAPEPSLFALVEMAQPAQAKNVAPHYAAPYFEMQR